MERKGRQDLKNNFTNGSLPTAAHFKQLIDSVLNLQDDDFQSLLLQMGGPLRLYLNEQEKEEKEVLIEFFKSVGDTRGDSVWRFVLSKEKGGTHDILILQNEKRESILEISQKGEVKINSTLLHLGGRVFIPESIGSYPSINQGDHVPADGKWHPILTKLKGCQMYDIVARAGGDSARSKNYSMIKSTATLIPINRGLLSFLFPDRSTIQTLHSYAGSSRNKIDLKWDRDDTHAQLMIRSRSDFKGGIRIHYRIKRTWTDEIISNA
ncbi:MAG: hypothetical protein ABJF11_03255 [Reichenbachiella sp.]|uniref:hypothetical protein n=1 Tax=Reichenbachiella sp. TaxID=2184521 RepID=UPI003263ABFC